MENQLTKLINEIREEIKRYYSIHHVLPNLVHCTDCQRKMLNDARNNHVRLTVFIDEVEYRFPI